MKYYSSKNKNFDRREWYKHIHNLERKIDSLYTYLNLTKPNYNIVNWNKENKVTDDNFMKTQGALVEGAAIYSKTWGDKTYEFYFLKCFNNNDLIWYKTNMKIINDFLTNDNINKIENILTSSNLDLSLKLKFGSNYIEPNLMENSWILIDKNTESGYRLLPSTSGYGSIYTMKWINKSGNYGIYQELTNNGKGVTTRFFNSPYQVRWNKFCNFFSSDDNRISIVDNKDIVTCQNKEFYQGQKQLMNKILKKDVNNNYYEYVAADCLYTKKGNLQQVRSIKTTINMEVYYW